MMLGSLTALVFFAAGPPQPARGQTPRDALAKLCTEYWDGYLAANPIEATSLGDRRFDAKLSDITPAGRSRERKRLQALRDRVEAVPFVTLSEADRVTRTMLAQAIADDLARIDCDLVAWLVDPLDGPQVSFLNVPAQMPIRTRAEADAMVARFNAMGPWVDDLIANLQRGLREKRVATKSQVDRVLGQLDALAKEPIDEWTLVGAARNVPADWSPADRERFAGQLRAAVETSVRPAFARYRDFIAKEIAPVARPQEKVGLTNLPGGADAYTKLARIHTSLELSPDRLHKIGLSEIERIDAEMAALGAKVLGTSDRAEILRRLRTDPKLHFTTRDEVETKARETLARAQAAVPKWFGEKKPRAACEVVRMEEHEEQHSTIAYYRQPAIDGSRPGRYYINTWAADTRPRYEAEALAFHEAVPGHHLQIAISQELTDLPEFRKHLGCTAFVEGWALYTERLADEMGLYSSDLDRIGMLSYEAWRASRLVVDTGMHAMGWSRQQAIDYMVAHTALAENNIANEVDRYIGWPGQALAYKVGQMEFLHLRDRWKTAQGDRYDIRAFHDLVLRHGAVTLPTLQQLVLSPAGGDAAR
jgi:uncharacterized protein (DUF885 family)